MGGGPRRLRGPMRLPSSSSPGSSRSGSGCWGCGGCGGVGFFRFGIVVAAMAAVGREGGGEGARADSVSVSGGRAAAARRSPAISLPGGCGELACGHLTFFPTSGHAPSSSFSATPGGGHEPSLSRFIFFFPKVRAAPCPRGHQEAEAQKSSPASRHQPLQEASGGHGPAVWRSAASLHPRARRC